MVQKEVIGLLMAKLLKYLAFGIKFLDNPLLARFEAGFRLKNILRYCFCSFIVYQELHNLRTYNTFRIFDI